MVNPLLDAALALAARGFHVFPCKLDKSPLTAHGFKDATTDAGAIRDWWAKWPTASIGLATGKVSGLTVVDLDGSAGIAAFDELSATRGGDEIGDPLIVETGGGGRHLYYAYVEGAGNRQKINGKPIDVRADGGYVIVPPSPHASGKSYCWANEGGGVPGVMPEWLRAFIVKPKPAPVTYSPAPRFTSPAADIRDRAIAYLATKPAAIQGQNGSARLFDAMRDMVYGFDLGPDAGLEVIREHYNPRCVPEWSDRELEHKARDADATEYGKPRGYLLADDGFGVDAVSVDWVDDLNGGPIRGGDGAAATDKPAAKTCPNCEQETADPVCECGFEFSTPKIEDTATTTVEVAAEPLEAAAELIEEIEPELSPADPGPFPVDIATDAPGMLGELVAYDQRTSEKPQPALALAGALSVLSVITGRKLAGRRDTRTNLLMVGLAPSGAGKSHARDWARQLLAHAGAGELVGPQRIGSHAGIISWLNDHPAAFFPVDEFGDLLSLMKQTGMKMGAVGNIEPTLKALYSSANDPAWIGDALARADHVKTINQPHLVLYGTCPPSHYWGNLTAANIENGLLARFIVFEAVKVQPVTHDIVEPFPASIRDRVTRWFAFKPGPETALHPIAVIATYTEGALATLAAHAQAIFDKGEKEDERTTAIWNRCAEKTSKLALIAAASRINDPAADTVTVTESDVAWAKRLAVYTTRRMVWRIFESVADNAEEERKKALLRLVPEWPDKIDASALTRKTQKLKRSERSSALDDLIAGRFVGQERIPAGKSGPAKTFYWRNRPKNQGGTQR